MATLTHQGRELLQALADIRPGNPGLTLGQLRDTLNLADAAAVLETVAPAEDWRWVKRRRDGTLWRWTITATGRRQLQ